MKITIFVLITIVLMSCQASQTSTSIRTNTSDLETIDIRSMPKEYFISNYDLYKIQNDIFIGQDSVFELHHANSNDVSIGKYARNNEGKVSYLKVDEYQSLNAQGKLIEKGKFNIGRYTQCCGGGLCSQFYNYKYGEWEYYYPNGNKKAFVSYQVKEFHLSTSCEGGVNLNFGQIDLSKSTFWNKSETPIEPSTELIKELETVVYQLGDSYRQSISINETELELDMIFKNKQK